MFVTQRAGERGSSCRPDTANGKPVLGAGVQDASDRAEGVEECTCVVNGDTRNRAHKRLSRSLARQAAAIGERRPISWNPRLSTACKSRQPACRLFGVAARQNRDALIGDREHESSPGFAAEYDVWRSALDEEHREVASSSERANLPPESFATEGPDQIDSGLALDDGSGTDCVVTDRKRPRHNCDPEADELGRNSTPALVHVDDDLDLTHVTQRVAIGRRAAKVSLLAFSRREKA